MAKSQVTVYNVLSLFTAVFECMCFGGLFTAWPAVQYMFEDEGYFNHTCFLTKLLNYTTEQFPCNETDISRCNQQDRMLGLVFIIPVACMFISAYFIGCIYDRCGTRVTRCMGTIMFNMGCLFISESTYNQSWMLFPGMILYNVGGSAFALITNAQLGNLFVWRAAVITLLVGCVQSSSITTVVMKMIFDTGVGTTWIFRVMNLLSITVWLRTFLFMPKMFIPYPLPKHGYVCGLQELVANLKQIIRKTIHQEKYSVTSQVKSPMSPDAHQTDVNAMYGDDDSEASAPNFLFFLKTPTFWSEVWYTVVLHVRNACFVATLLPWFGNTFALDQEGVGEMIGHFSWIQSGVILTAPFNGLLIDLMSKHYLNNTKGATEDIASSKALYVSKILTSCIGTLFSVLVCINILPLQYASMIVFLVFRSFIYGGFYSFISILYPRKHFGKLSGFCQGAWGLLQLLQYPLLSLVQDVFNGDFLPVNIIFSALCFLTVVHPLFNLLKVTKNERKLKNATGFSVVPV